MGYFRLDFGPILNNIGLILDKFGISRCFYAIYPIVGRGCSFFGRTKRPGLGDEAISCPSLDYLAQYGQMLDS